MTNKEYFSAEFSKNRDQWLCADSWAEAELSTQSRQPALYVIQVSNTKGQANNVQIGNAFTNRTTENFGQDSGITITSTIVGVTYQEFLAQSESQPFTVGRTMIISTSSGQLDHTITIIHRNAAGDRVDHVIAPTLDPYQEQSDRVLDEYEFLFDGMTTFQLSRLNALATVTVRFYLVNKFAASQVIASRPAIQQYEPSRIISVATQPVR